MPAPYPLLELPPGDFANQYDFVAINMAAAHNMYIQGLNAVMAHAPHVKGERVAPFLVFALALFGNIHHHHRVEEEYYFPEIEKKLGKGALAGNVEEHSEFVPHLEETERWLKNVQAGKEEWNGQLLVDQINSWGDLMHQHLAHVRNSDIGVQQTPAVFTEKELIALEKGFMAIAMKTIDPYIALPIALVTVSPTAPWFPPLPWIAKVATRWWFYRRHAEAWTFGTSDLHGRPVELPKPLEK